MRKVVVLTGAGISAESGIRTFREMGGMWEEYDVMEVASPEGWNNNMDLVLKFYNDRRLQLKDVEPNAGHLGLKDLEDSFDVQIITQNVDDLHERAGSSDILHLHGELTKVRSSTTDRCIQDIGYNILSRGDLAEDGGQLRPHIVWFGESVPAFEEAIEIARTADIFVIVGTSLNVYPAAGIVHYIPTDVPIYIIDPNEVAMQSERFHLIQEPASTGVSILKTILFGLQ